ncbi:MAG: divalent-cation tolerance protein CutA [Candidatus Omnitrophica bacterium]|nr:divalent-cation tolerance protein CutA [Candidatus Omnitrophota bacterium]
MAILVMVTIPKDNAKLLAKILLAEKLCACVNIIDEVKSLFWWQGKIDEEKEALLLIKTKKSLFIELENLIKKNHPYKVPEIIGFEINKINNEYSNWLNKECQNG